LLAKESKAFEEKSHGIAVDMMFNGAGRMSARKMIGNNAFKIKELKKHINRRTKITTEKFPQKDFT